MSKKKSNTAIPEELSGNALLAWHEFTADAGELFTPVDRAAMILLCKAWAEIADAERHIEKNGTVIKMPNGYPGANPYCKIRNEARACVLKLLSELGLTPNSRSRIQRNAGTEEAEDADALDF